MRNVATMTVLPTAFSNTLRAKLLGNAGGTALHRCNAARRDARNPRTRVTIQRRARAGALRRA
eukprot:2813966-Lingulodinium_polyedra.AAC.1